MLSKTSIKSILPQKRSKKSTATAEHVSPGNVQPEIEPYTANWKNYYKILHLSSNVKPAAIKKSFKRLAHLCHHSLSDNTKKSALFSAIMSDINEAYQVLSDPARRASYDRVYAAKLNTHGAEITREEITNLMELVAQNVSELKRWRDWRIPQWAIETQRAVLTALVSLVIIFAGGTSFAFAQPENTLATPFRGTAITALKASSGTIGLIEDIGGIVAGYERNIVHTSLQSMRVLEGLSYVPAVNIPTNDMSCFPSAGHPLFPGYLDKKFSQFQYTVDSDGIVAVHTLGATTDAFLEKIRQLLNRLAEAE